MQEAVMRPLAALSTLLITLALASSATDGPTTAPSPPPVPRQVDTGVCQLSHLGRTTIRSVQDIDLATGTQVSVELTFTAANGDVLRATNVGTSAPSGPGVRFQGNATFSGGTGRFANATGVARLEGTANFLTNTAAFTVVDGWIAYEAAAGSQRR